MFPQFRNPSLLLCLREYSWLRLEGNDWDGSWKCLGTREQRSCLSGPHVCSRAAPQTYQHKLPVIDTQTREQHVWPPQPCQAVGGRAAGAHLCARRAPGVGGAERAPASVPQHASLIRALRPWVTGVHGRRIGCQYVMRPWHLSLISREQCCFVLQYQTWKE